MLARRAPFIVVCIGSLLPSFGGTARTLTFDDRVAAQRAIEQVYWDHRTWPAENKTPKPPLSVVLPDDAIRAKVDNYLRQSNALEQLWQRPIAARDLQAELDRMSRDSRDPETLRALFAALANDPALIAETLARQTLSDRLVRSWYASDDRFHGELKRRAKAEAASCDNAGCLRSMSGSYIESTLKRSDHEDAWTTLANQAKGTLEETPDSFSVTAELARSAGEITTARVVWNKQPFDTWWDASRAKLDTGVAPIAGTFSITAPAAGGCVVDTWKVTPPGLDQRMNHTAVWTGSEMIVWGGSSSDQYFNTGGRYNPSTDTWLPTSIGTNLPTPRHNHTAVWTGSEMIVWGGSAGAYVSTGGRYNPTTDTWTPTSTGAGVPQARDAHTAVWTGSLMIVWGGNSATGLLNSGGRYDPVAESWTPTSVGTNVPGSRIGHTAVWTGTRMIVWGGRGYDYFGDGSRYDPATDTWQPTSSAGLIPRRGHSAVWTGSEMIVWGGLNAASQSQLYDNTGSRYDPVTDTWVATSTAANVPTARSAHTAVWTGNKMIVWGGSGGGGEAVGGRYDPSTNSWQTTATNTGPSVGLTGHSAVWTGTEMIVWGGGVSSNSGSRYSPASDSWVPTARASVVEARYGHSSVWTGNEMIVWGGASSGGYATNTGSRYVPVTDTWTAVSTGPGVPSARSIHCSVWTGTQMIIWGGEDSQGNPITGGRYNVAGDSWQATSTGANVPPGRGYATAAWTGSRMIVWGGRDYFSGYHNTGGRYDPVSDSWLKTSTGANVPMVRYFHSAVWTGSEMIVWGGFLSFQLSSGGRYNPSTDTWLPTSMGANLPYPRGAHTAVWTGSEMIVWGGYNDVSRLNTGGRYDPASDTWTPTSTGTNVPPARALHSAVWTQTEMIVWGGNDGNQFVNSGGRYNPSTDSWAPTSTGPNVPIARYGHSSHWTGTEMIVWGGYASSLTSSGGRYCADSCAVPQTLYRDLDGDGYGIAGVTQVTCASPAGWAPVAGDCNDALASVHPGAAEVNDGLDNNCPGDFGYGMADEIDGIAGFLTPGDKTAYSWPAQALASEYEVLRGSSSLFSAGCTTFATVGTTIVDPDVPGVNAAFYYLVRAMSPFVGSYGTTSYGVEEVAACP